ncbi:type II toxin-antitoxin system VapC family toxin [Mycobacterium sp. 21AC1]|uniref:type II toxin-antitoxin system VapC family toxin n=1 Tax=[Mycobacterium] appelbergii TaxID=2939269 RepID=UPI002939257B|nr:type II toxin-antitoxin system VapC family toxin [Mycobacterium sp. 21AC1]MDV3125753.1 type II toxin-antitoxin system VapC family toxin [Mycobacterium sp. 21AC1]
MLILDVNIVLAVHRGDHPDHESVLAWFDQMLDSDERFAVPTLIWGSFLRLATNRRIFEVPSPRDEAFSFVTAVSAQPNHLTIGPGPRHLALLEKLCDEADASGDLIPDAVLAAIAAEHHCDVVTLDRDFARFTSVRHIRPTTQING